MRQERTCAICARVGTSLNVKHCARHGGDLLCGTCYKRLVWRPAGGESVDKERAANLAWKDRNREANRARDRAYAARRRSVDA